MGAGPQGSTNGEIHNMLIDLDLNTNQNRVNNSDNYHKDEAQTEPIGKQVPSHNIHKDYRF
jgi:hypothetical protein